MATFDDQFERHDPLTLKFDAPSESWPRRIAFEAQTVLSDAARPYMTQIAFTIDAVISARAERMVRATANGSGAISEFEEDLRRRGIALARHVHGDVALFSAGGVESALLALSRLSTALTEADLYAVLALWKLIDYLDFRARPRLAKQHLQFAWASIENAAGGLSDLRSETNKRVLESSLAEGAHASATAWQIAQGQMRTSGRQGEAETAMRQRDALVEARTHAVKEANATRARFAANAQHAKPGGSRDKQVAIRACWATGKYTSRDRCAEEECAALGMSFATARKALRNTPDPA